MIRSTLPRRQRKKKLEKRYNSRKRRRRPNFETFARTNVRKSALSSKGQDRDALFRCLHRYLLLPKTPRRTSIPPECTLVLTHHLSRRMLSINEDIQTRQHYADLSQKDLMEFSEEDSIALHSSSPDSCLSPLLFDSQCSPNPQSPELGLSFSPPGQIFSSVDQSTSYPGLSSSDYPTSRWNPPPSPAMYQQAKYFRDDFVPQLLQLPRNKIVGP